MSELAKINSITNRILDAGKRAYAELFNACDELYQTLISIAGIDVIDNSNTENVPLEHGEAIGLSWAALCIRDLMRTKKFMDGVYQATLAKVNSNPDRPVHILYTGTGPFATLVLPLIPRFSRQIQLSLLEVNDASFDCLQNFINTFQLEGYVHRLEKADATKWKLPSGEHFDIFICETMQQGLKKEPQVAICKNIVPQLLNDTIIIPKQIILTAALINPDKRMQEKLEQNSEGHSIHNLGTIFTLDKDSILKSENFPETTVDIPQELANKFSDLSILTEIQIYGDQKLLIDESALTLPLRIGSVTREKEIRFGYQISANPGVRFEVLR